MSETKQAYLMILEPVAGDAFSLKDKNVIGKDASCDICIPNKSLENHHALIEYQDVDYYIINKFSYEILVNGEALKHKKKLENGDVIGLASVRLMYAIGEESIEEIIPEPDLPCNVLSYNTTEDLEKSLEARQQEFSTMNNFERKLAHFFPKSPDTAKGKSSEEIRECMLKEKIATLDLRGNRTPRFLS